MTANNGGMNAIASHPGTLRGRIEARGSSWVQVAILVLLLLGLLRALALLAQDPLLAYANSYDQVRYTACFDLYPDRPAYIPPTDNSPWAPYSQFVFRDVPQPMCYWSTELLPQGLVALGFRVSEALGGTTQHSVRWLGTLRFAALLVLILAVTLAWLKRERPHLALANAALLPLLFADPANTLYLNGWYAEWSALCALYAVIALVLLEVGRAPTRRAVVLLSLAAFALGMSKLQHLVLPLAIASALLACDWLLFRRRSWQALALVPGALLALGVQAVQMQRDNPLLEGIRQANAVDVVLTGLLPSSADPATTLRRLGLGQDCLAHIGKHAWELPSWDYGAHCTGIERLSRTRELGLAMREPGTFLTLAWRGVESLDSWLAKGLGTVEDGGGTPLPISHPSLGRPLAQSPALRLAMMVLPFCAAWRLLRSSRRRSDTLALPFTVMTIATMTATLALVVLGDGLADTAKQGHLVFNAALAWAMAMIAVLYARVMEAMPAPQPAREASNPMPQAR